MAGGNGAEILKMDGGFVIAYFSIPAYFQSRVSNFFITEIEDSRLVTLVYSYRIINPNYIGLFLTF